MDRNFQSESAVVLIEDAANLQQHAVEVTNVVIVVDSPPPGPALKS